MSVNTSYEEIRSTVTGDITAGFRVQLTWQFNPDVSVLSVLIERGEGQDDLVVMEREITYNADDNSVLIAADTEGLVANAVVIVRRRTPITQLENFSTAEYIPEQSVERALDKLVFIAQELGVNDN